MATFQFTATDKSGQERRGTIDAADRASAIASIRAQGYFPSAIGEVKAPEPAAAGTVAKKSGGMMARSTAAIVTTGV